MKKLFSILTLVLITASLVACGGDLPPEPETLPPAVASEPQPEPEPEPLEVAYLTGAEKTADYPEGQRIAAVMVGNTPGARPAAGIGDAKILIEIDANAKITRFLALYEDYKNMPRVGSVRSARDPFVQLLIPTYGFFVHEGPGEQQPARTMLQQYDYYNNYDLDNVRYKANDRTGNGFTFFYTDGETVANAVEKKGYDDFRAYNSPIFSFSPYNEPRRELPDGAATEVAITLTPSFRTSFAFNAEAGNYAMSQFNSYTGGVEPTVDANNNEQLAFENVLVIFAPFDVWPGTQGEGGLTRVDFTQGGGAFLISNGSYQRVIWRKGGPDQPLRLENIDGSGEAVALNVGKTYIAVVDDTRAEAFYEQLQTGNAGDHATGEVNTGL
ncbi:DUF3048 domain-containing protein, partial [Ruminococcaceae bacterium OttesenSCG-928-A16]|nr:DUF3048 domain-containing protein [Ruminococcaceae bacterium OttesenSCG-928-A16]